MRFHFLQLLLWLAIGLSSQTALAQVVAPTQGGGVSLVRVTATTIELSFGTKGNGQGRVLAVAETEGGMPVPLIAVDGQFYTANYIYGQGSALGKGYVIYTGAGHTVTVTGLKPSTSYYFTDAEYNTDGTSIIYNVRGTGMSTTTRSAPITLAPTPTPLPVELTAFTGNVDTNNIATLYWATASERNSAYFALERSVDGSTFTEISRTAAAATSNQKIAYQYSDTEQLSRATYYRLRQVDNDGTAHYSVVVVLAPTLRIIQRLDVYPNPSAGQPVQLMAQGYNNERIMLQVTDAVGRTIMTQTVESTSTQYSASIKLPQDLSAGTYILTLTCSNSLIQKRFVVSN